MESWENGLCSDADCLVVRFVIENGGYTVERLIHGRDAAYNKVPLWDYTMMLKAFGSGLESKSFRVGKSAELDALLSDEAFGNASYPQVSF